MKHLLAWWLGSAVLCLVSWWVVENNDYMSYRDYPVTLVAKSAPVKCVKRNCRANHTGLFKMEDGSFSERSISLYTYSQRQLNDQFVLNMRPFDLRQTGMQNLYWFFLPTILYSVTLFAVIIAVIASGKMLLTHWGRNRARRNSTDWH